MHQNRKIAQERGRDAIEEKYLFYAWECVSLLTHKRSYDFIIKNRTDMLTFINAVNALTLPHYYRGDF